MPASRAEQLFTLSIPTGAQKKKRVGGYVEENSVYHQHTFFQIQFFGFTVRWQADAPHSYPHDS